MREVATSTFEFNLPSGAVFSTNSRELAEWIERLRAELAKEQAENAETLRLLEQERNVSDELEKQIKRLRAKVREIEAQASTLRLLAVRDTERLAAQKGENAALLKERGRILSDYADLCEVGALAKMKAERDALRKGFDAAMWFMAHKNRMNLPRDYSPETAEKYAAIDAAKDAE